MPSGADGWHGGSLWLGISTVEAYYPLTNTWAEQKIVDRRGAFWGFHSFDFMLFSRHRFAVSPNRKRGITMSKKQFSFVLVAVVIFAFLGGLLSGRIFSGQTVFAQEPHSITAREFRLIDSRGTTRGVLGVTSNDSMATFELNDRMGTRRIFFIVDGNGNPSAHFWDRQADGGYKPANTPSINFWNRDNGLRSKLP